MQSSLCEYLLNLSHSSLIDHQLVAVDNVINIDEVCEGGVAAGDVPGAEDHVLVDLGGNHHSLLLGADGGQEGLKGLGLDLVHLDLVHNDQVAGSNLRGQSGLQGQSLNLLVQGVAVISGLGCKHNAAVSPLGSADGALTGAAGALLAPRLNAAAADLSAGQGALGTLAAVRQMVLYHIVHNRQLLGSMPNTASESSISPTCLPCHIINIRLRHELHSLFP